MIDPVTGSEHSNDGRYQRRRENKPIAKISSASVEEYSNSRVSVHPVLPDSETRLVVDDDNHVVRVEFVDRKTGAVIAQISEQELELNDRHGVLIDVAT